MNTTTLGEITAKSNSLGAYNVTIFDNKLDPAIINSPLFKEDSVREEIITPILKALGYSAFGSNMIIRSKTLDHPIYILGQRKNI